MSVNYINVFFPKGGGDQTSQLSESGLEEQTHLHLVAIKPALRPIPCKSPS